MTEDNPTFVPDTYTPRPVYTKADDMSPEEAIASAIIPWPYDDSRAKYLRLRACGFSIREALHWTGNANSTLSLWRKDEKFLSIEDKLPEYRNRLREEHLDNQFVRNFAMLLEKDSRVVQRSLQTREVEQDGKKLRLPVILTKQEQDYLLKMRSLYTPQQLEAIKAVVQSVGDREFNFQDIVLGFRNLEGKVRAQATQVVLEVDTTHELSTLPEPNGDSE